MSNQKIIAIGCDHRGFAMKEFLIKQKKINDISVTWHDVGAHDEARSDYPIFAIQVIKAMQNKEVDLAILLCANGIGMGIVANRFPGIFAGIAWNTEVARTAKEDDHINVLVLPSEFVTNQKALEIVDVWLKAEFKNGRYQKRIEMINEI